MSAVVFPASGQDYIDQLQVASGITIRHTLTPGAGTPLNGDASGLTVRYSGSIQAERLEAGGAVFSLYAVRRGAAAGEAPRLVFTKALGSLTPQASLTLSSADPHVPVRTRADVPFTVRTAASAWEDLAGALSIECERFNPVTHAGRSPADVRVTATTAFGDGVRSFSRMTELKDADGGDDPASIEGMETFTVWARPNGFPEWTVVRQGIRILPVAQVAVTGVDEGENLAETPQIDGVFTNLYPASETYFQVYPGAAGEGKTGLIITGSRVVHQAQSPQTSRVRIAPETLEPYFPDDGIYTLEAVTVTPLKPSPERLWRRTFTLARRLEIRGRIGSQ